VNLTHSLKYLEMLNKRLTKLDYPCECGHPVGLHSMEETNIFKFCNYQFTVGATHACRCSNYKADNLKYLEQLSEK